MYLNGLFFSIVTFWVTRYHQVSSTGRNIAVNIWWKHLHSFVPSKCDNMEKGATLDKFSFTSLEKKTGEEGEGEEEAEGLDGLL